MRGSSVFRASSSFNTVTLPPSCPHKSWSSGGEAYVLPFLLLPFEGVLFECLGEYYLTLASGNGRMSKIKFCSADAYFGENIGNNLFLKRFQSMNFPRLA